MNAETRRRLEETLEREAHLLPGQAPLSAFVHHNTLHLYEDLPFHQAVQEAERTLGGNAYMSLARFRAEFAAGRIRQEDLDVALGDLAGGEHMLVAGLRVEDVRRVVCMEDLSALSFEELRFAVEEESFLDIPLVPIDVDSAKSWLSAQETLDVGTELCPLEMFVDRFGPPRFAMERDPVPIALRAMWKQCSRLAGSGVRHRRIQTRQESEVDGVLIPLCASYLDGGLAYWPMPNREQGFYRASLDLLRRAAPFTASWRRPLARQAEQEYAQEWDAWRSLEHSLQALGLKDTDQAFREQLLALPGWAGMFARLEHNPQDRVVALEYRLVDYLAVRMLLRRVIPPRDETTRDELVSTTSILFRFAQHARLSLAELASMDVSEGQSLLAFIESFEQGEARAVLQEAYERCHRHELLDAVARVAQERSAEVEPSPRIQVCCCIDDREESFRRHLEELGTQFQTFGIAGFYGLKISYRGLMDAHSRALCPASMKPDHEIHEIPESEEQGRRWRRRFELAGRTGFAGHVSSRTMFRGFTLSLAGLFESIPMALRTVAPRQAHQLRTELRTRALRPPRTKLTAMQSEAGGPGYTVDEAAEILTGVLEDMALLDFAPLVVVLGHGSTSMNNPHEAAHECGACAGGKGGPNARLFADLINRSELREALRVRGIDIPDSTVFVGGIHDTSNDLVDLYDLHRVPETHHELLAEARDGLDRAREMDAHERVRRFHSVPLGVTPKGALRHVEGRAQNLAEPRPEYGHCTNAVCLVGRRWLSRGLFLDRRAFLVSYDPTRDDDGAILERLLASVGPVGAGINLEYYFSYVDQDVYGCGTKLPHNVVGLHGVMNGCLSDLRTGLPYQMVDIHEPVRLVTVVEATVERLEEIARRRPQVGKLVSNRWIQLVAMHPETGALTEHTRGGWKPYSPDLERVRSFDSSIEAYEGTRAHIAPAAITAGLTQ